MIRASPLDALHPDDASWAGSKAVRLGQLARAGFTVPPGVVIGADTYGRFVAETGLTEAIQLLMHRKRFEDMRWEELWDLALRVRNRFLRTPLPQRLRAELEAALAARPVRGPAAVRSAALGEDSASASFAGLHDSFIHVIGTDAILDRVRLVWASLWSDRALLYRQELGLDPRRSRIAVIVQEMIPGSASGVAFSVSPTDPDELLIEGVWGLNQALVDGTVPPHRWHLDRATGRLLRLSPADQHHELKATGPGARLAALDPAKRGQPPLGAHAVRELYTAVRAVERLFEAPQDVEWTLEEHQLVVLQARPITSLPDSDETRRWYLSLHRSIDNLEQLRDTLLREVLPGMNQEAEALAALDLGILDHAALADEIRRRQTIQARWVAAYWQHCIPFAHGVRLFGEIYNDRVAPEDPFEFIQLLTHDDLLGTRRDAELSSLAQDLAAHQAGRLDAETFGQRLDAVVHRYGLGPVLDQPRARQDLMALLARLHAGRPRPPRASPQLLRERFLDRFAGQEQQAMAQLLALARDSYRLRDDDNIYLGRIEAQLLSALREAERRVAGGTCPRCQQTPVAVLIHLLEDPALAALTSKGPEGEPSTPAPFHLHARQLVGQPASPGLAVGPARVILARSELLAFREGEVLVCDAIDPTLTFVAPLAAAIVERRGGMLIHGAIIAREYGIPCVTGVPDAATWIQSGDTLTVDGHLGLVTVSARAATS